LDHIALEVIAVGVQEVELYADEVVLAGVVPAEDGLLQGGAAEVLEGTPGRTEVLEEGLVDFEVGHLHVVLEGYQGVLRVRQFLEHYVGVLHLLHYLQLYQQLRGAPIVGAQHHHGLLQGLWLDGG
jgi:hypothetical protein